MLSKNRLAVSGKSCPLPRWLVRWPWMSHWLKQVDGKRSLWGNNWSSGAYWSRQNKKFRFYYPGCKDAKQFCDDTAYSFRILLKINQTLIIIYIINTFQYDYIIYVYTHILLDVCILYFGCVLTTCAVRCWVLLALNSGRLSTWSM